MLHILFLILFLNYLFGHTIFIEFLIKFNIQDTLQINVKTKRMNN